MWTHQTGFVVRIGMVDNEALSAKIALGKIRVDVASPCERPVFFTRPTILYNISCIVSSEPLAKALDVQSWMRKYVNYSRDYVILSLSSTDVWALKEPGHY